MREGVPKRGVVLRSEATGTDFGAGPRAEAVADLTPRTGPFKFDLARLKLSPRRASKGDFWVSLDFCRAWSRCAVSQQWWSPSIM